MTSARTKINLGVVGCGAIGSRIALSVKKELRHTFMISALYDTDKRKSGALASRFNPPPRIAETLNDAIRYSDMIIEAVNTPATSFVVRESLLAGKNVLAMSIGRLLGNRSLFALAETSPGKLLLPSGAIAGIDAIKAAALAGITSITLTSIKPFSGFSGNDYVIKKNLLKTGAKKDVLLFEGSVKDAVRLFPQNINVAATVALAAGPKANVRARIIASASVKRNTHEIVLEGNCGKISTRSENVVCPDNPKTSYLAVLSGIKTLQQFAMRVNVGT